MPALPAVSALTYEDYLQFPEDGLRHEIIDGEHWMSPSPSPLHQRILVKLTIRLGAHIEAGKLGELLVAPCDLVLSPEVVVQPDLFFVAREHADILQEKRVLGTPDLVIEILSDSTRQRDLTLKRKLYERFGVVEYWVMDPEVERVEVYARDENGAFAPPRLESGPEATLETPLLPGLSLPLATIFE